METKGLFDFVAGIETALGVLACRLGVRRSQLRRAGRVGMTPAGFYLSHARAPFHFALVPIKSRALIS
jgi:hypothetical protein